MKFQYSLLKFIFLIYFNITSVCKKDIENIEKTLLSDFTS